MQTISSGGTQPISLTVHHDLIYVLNAGGASANITGFRIVPEAQASKTLVPIVGSTQSLPNGGAASPAEISFSPDGRVILVTEPGAGQIASFTVSQTGQASLVGTFSATANGPFGLVFSQSSFAVTASLQAQDASSLMPTGMAFSNDGRYLYVRNGGNQTVSGFLIQADGSLTPITQVGGLSDTAAGIAAR